MPLYIYTVFDRSHDGCPLLSGLYDPVAKALQFHIFYLPGTGKSIADIENTIELLGKHLNSTKSVVCNDYKQHLAAFGCKCIGTPYDIPMPSIGDCTSIKQYRGAIAAALASMCKIGPAYWQVARANAARVYAHLQERGVLYGYNLMHPIWSLDAFSGRSKSSGFNIQGCDGTVPLSNINNDPIFINFDWVAADLRAISLMCHDSSLENSFTISDPYQYMVDGLNRTSLAKRTRDDGKIELLSSIYAFRNTGQAVQFYPGLSKWMQLTRQNLRDSKYTRSILGRQFNLSDAQSRKNPEGTVFNATFQGTVAHAMQLCLKKVWDIFPDNILTENHDSLVMTCTKNNLSYMIKTVARIMVQPFHKVLKNNPQFPIKISVGKVYKHWKFIKRYNTYASI